MSPGFGLGGGRRRSSVASLSSSFGGSNNTERLILGGDTGNLFDLVVRSCTVPSWLLPKPPKDLW